MKLTDSKQPGWQKLLFFIGIGFAFFLYVNLTGDESWLLSKEEKQRRRVYTIAQHYINKTYAPPSPAEFPPIDEVTIKSIGGDEFQVDGWVYEPDFNGVRQQFEFTMLIMKKDGIWKMPMLSFKAINYNPAETTKSEETP